MKCKRMYFYSRYLIYSLSSLSLHHSHVHDVGRPIRALGRRSTMRDSRAPSSMSGVSVALALVSDPFIAFTSPMTSSLEPSLVASLAPRSRRYLLRGASAWRMATDQPTSLLVERFDESVRRLSGESSRIVNAGGARARLSSEVILRRSSSRVDVSRTCRGRERSLGGEIA